MVFTVAGFAVGASALGWLDVSVESSVAERVTEIALVLLLFSDAARLDLKSLRHELGWPTRLLLIGLPLTMVAGVGVGLLVFPGMALASVVLLSTMLASTDAALGQKVVSDTSVPARVRQALDVESGLNDGLAVPFFLVALDIANAELKTGVTWAVVSNAAAQIGWGLVGGLAAGVLGGLLFRVADRRRWIGGEWRQIVPLAVALLAYAIALHPRRQRLHRRLRRRHGVRARLGCARLGRHPLHGGDRRLLRRRHVDRLRSAGARAGRCRTSPGRSSCMPLLSLTLVRMVPVAIAMAGRGARLPTVAFIGWFGPRGLASVVFALLVVERGVPEEQTLVTTVVVTVALSVVLHGLTSVPLVGAYHRWYEAHAAGHPAAEEAAPATMPRRRRQLDAADIVGRRRDHGSE